MITREKYLKALDIVNTYSIQVDRTAEDADAHVKGHCFSNWGIEPNSSTKKKARRQRNKADIITAIWVSDNGTKGAFTFSSREFEAPPQTAQSL